MSLIATSARSLNSKDPGFPAVVLTWNSEPTLSPELSKRWAWMVTSPPICGWLSHTTTKSPLAFRATLGWLW